MNNRLMKKTVLSRALNSQELKIYRREGVFVNGRWTEVPQSPEYFEVKGVCYPSSEKELLQIPEGDRIVGAITFLTTERLYVTRRTITSSGLSDKIEWDGDLFKIVGTLPWKDYGFFACVAIRESGA